MSQIIRCFTCKKDVFYRRVGKFKKFKSYRIDSNKKHKCKIVFKPKVEIIKVTSGLRIKDRFYDSNKWIKLRKKVFLIYDKRCMDCGCVNSLQVDHIKPRSIYPALELDLENMQILCKKCNKLKSNHHSTDYRNNDDIQCLVDFKGWVYD